MMCPRCGEPMSGGVCDNCGFPVTKGRKKSRAKKKIEYVFIDRRNTIKELL